MRVRHSRLIDTERRIERVSAPLPEPHDYAAVLRADFVASYRSGRDVWSSETAMRVASDILHHHLARPSDILDVGTGRGHDAASLLERGHRVVAIDLVEAEEWTQLTARWGDRVRFHAHGLGELGGAERFDAVLDNGCLHHQHPDEYAAHLSRIHALLRPEGLLTIAVFAANSSGHLYVNETRRLYREFTDFELAELLIAARFEPISFDHVPRLQVGLKYLVITARQHRSPTAPSLSVTDFPTRTL